MGGISHATTISTARAGLIRPRSLLRAHRDERLVAQLRAGNERAFEALFDRYRPRLLAFCRGMLHSSEDAEDVLQEVFTAAHSAILADDRAIEVRPWLYRIARNRCLNHMRRPQPEAQESLDEHPHENGTTTEDRAARREDLRHLVENIRELPETQRSALLMRELEALSYGEIASSLDTTVPAVKSLLVRARVSLAEASQANELSCSQVRFELAAAAEGIRKASGPVRHHARRCSDCTAYRNHLRSTSRGLTALAPVGPLLLLKRLISAKLSGGGGGSGAAGAGSGGAGAGVAGGTGTAGAGAAGTAGAAAVGGAGLIGSKAATGAAVVALFGAGGAAVTVTEPELPSPASIVTAIGGVKAVGEPGASPHRADSGGGSSEPDGTGSAGSSSDPADADDPDHGETTEGDEPADETAEDGMATEGESSGDAPGEDPGYDYDDDGASDDDSLLAARRERLRQLLASDRAAARRWWLQHRDQHTGDNPSPSSPRPPHLPQPDPPPPPPPPPPRDESPRADDRPQSPDGPPSSEEPRGRAPAATIAEPG